jgi:hypothetical protein
MTCAYHVAPFNMAYLRARTNLSWQDETWAEFSILEDVACKACGCHAIPGNMQYASVFQSGQYFQSSLITVQRQP